MFKTVIKEIFIMILLCIAIALIFGVVFYDYIPNNKVIPQKEAYTTPENVKEEIAEQITEVEKTIVSYEITDADLNIYKESQSYNPGKPDPFSLVETQNVVGENTTTPNSSSGNETLENSSSTQTDQNSTGTFWDDDGTK